METAVLSIYNIIGFMVFIVWPVLLTIILAKGMNPDNVTLEGTTRTVIVTSFFWTTLFVFVLTVNMVINNG